MRRLANHLVVATLAVIVPTAALGHSYGPPARFTGAPGDNVQACTQCHMGSALNSGSGSVKILLKSGLFYIPGVRQRVAVQVSDPTQRRWGFQFTARLNSNLENGQAGEFTSVDNMTQVLCSDSAPPPCASGPSFIENISAGTRNGTTGGATFEFDWSPPEEDAGPVTLYVAGNAANGDGTSNGDLIYTSSIELAPAVPSAPAITAGNVFSAATGVAGPVAANSWVTVLGTNLGVTTRSWDDSDFLNGRMPTSLDGVSVILTAFNNPRLAYVGYVSETQVNFLLPSDVSNGAVTVKVRNPAGTSATLPLTVQANAPQLFTLDGKYVLGNHANGTNVGKAGLVASVTTAPAAPGETIVVYGTGLGPTTPALIPGQMPATAANLATLPQVTIGGSPATVNSAGVVAGSPGLYQISLQVPANAPNGDLQLIVQVGTGSSAATLITVEK